MWWDGWYPPPQATHYERRKNAGHIYFEKTVASVKCGKIPQNVTHCSKSHGYCLFNIKNDPCEFNDLSHVYPAIFQEMLNKLNDYKTTMVPPRNNKTVDPLSNPKLHNGVWVPWINLDWKVHTCIGCVSLGGFLFVKFLIENWLISSLPLQGGIIFTSLYIWSYEVDYMHTGLFGILIFYNFLQIYVSQSEFCLPLPGIGEVFSFNHCCLS